ncbi:AI-2E family transporter [Tropicimonas sp. IMCC6043]|uniref:AI-2E family transporter n=1 Tax=Tropicimonas sp. IMCC6043 TaxID=2510645 RepID=UPI00101DE75D|nr:AI-2E family transporter [Tropicimonas sp. IMCC6043]RYH07280.1 AI-2E family transporter [Tropicimonas sp. IMCC6043]
MTQTDPVERASLVALALAAGVVLLELGQGLIASILLALVTGVVLAPFADRLTRIGLPPALAALSGLLATIALAGLFVLFLEPYIRELVHRAPLLWLEIRSAIDSLRDLLRGVEGMADSVAEAVSPSGTAAGSGDAVPSAEDAARSAVSNVSDAISYAPALAGQILIFVGTLFFFLLSRAELYALAATGNGRLSAERLLAAEQLVSRYFLTITIINAVLGLAVTGALALLGMPSPVLWGVLAFTANFVPYLGPVFFVIALAIAGIVVFDGAAGLLPAACYLGLERSQADRIQDSQDVAPMVLCL